MARIVTGAFTTFRLDLHLDPQTLDLYGVREIITTPSYGAFGAYTGSAPKLTFGANFQLGLGIVPAAWGIGKALQVGDYAALFFDGATGLVLSSNAYYSAGYKYIANDFASRYFQIAGSHTFSHAASGTAGNAVTFVNDLQIDASGNVLQIGPGGLGYGTGSGGSVSQLTSKATAVTLNKTNGFIGMNNAALAASTTVGFTVNNSTVASTDVVIVNMTGATSDPANYLAWVTNIGAGSFKINVRNLTAGSLSDTCNLSFAVIKAVTA